MEMKSKTKAGVAYTLKGLIVAAMTLMLLIPGCMVQSVIKERMRTRDEAVSKIDAKWSYAQTVSGPILSIPFTTIHRVNEKTGEVVLTENVFNVTPSTLEIRTKLYPEERYYGIYKTIVYKSVIEITGEFAPLDSETMPDGNFNPEKTYLRIGLSDLRGISDNIRFEMNGRSYGMDAAGYSDPLMGEILIINTGELPRAEALTFNCTLELKGSASINFLPLGRTTTVTVAGEWPDPGFAGNYSPEYTLSEEGFEAVWQVLRFNRNVPDTWINDNIRSDRDLSFGVNLVDRVDLYQQNMRSTKYALMFIALTFVVFFFVEIFTKRRIHPIQYLLVGVALILFYSLLLSISEPLGFGWAYLISSGATIGLITAYASSIFKQSRPTLLLAFILSLLYGFLYVILQLEDVALLAGSVGLFVILGIVMYFSRRISWYGDGSEDS